VIFSGTATTASTLFPVCSVIALGFYWVRKHLASFFFFFWITDYLDRTDSYPLRKGKDSDANGNSSVYYFAQAFEVRARPRAVF
jgi:hypothetical protein